jgi:hypothetical protein
MSARESLLLGELGKHLNSTMEYPKREDSTQAVRTSVHIDPRQSKDPEALAAFLRDPNLSNTKDMIAGLPSPSTTVDVQLYQSKLDTEDLSLKFQLGLGLGAGSTNIKQKLGLTDAWTITAGGVKHRTDCFP